MVSIFSKTVSMIGKDDWKEGGVKIIRYNANTSVTNLVTNPGKRVIHILPNLKKERQGKRCEVQKRLQAERKSPIENQMKIKVRKHC